MRKSDNGIAANVASLLICGLLAGVVVAAAAFPLFAASGLAAKAGGEAFGQLPVQLTVKQSPQISYVYASDNKTLIASIYDENRRDLPYAEIPERVRQAILAAEDQKFYDHNGVDVKGIARAFVANKTAGDVQQGASTITMQFVRMSISYAASSAEEVIRATEDTSARKLREIRYAIALEQKMTKEQILEGYLNTAYFGNRAYGIFAASQVYFGKHPKDLSVAEAALLAGMVKFPGDFDAATGKNKEKAIDRRDYVLNEMVGMQSITQAEADAAKKEQLKFVGTQTPNGCVQATNNSWGFFCDYVQRWWLQQEVFGTTAYDRERQLRSGGFRIVTTMDLTTEQAAVKNAIKFAPLGSPQALLLAAVEPGTGKVRALAANRNFKLDDKAKPQNGLHTHPKARAQGVRGSYPNTTNPLLAVDPAIQGYRPGSVMKLFTMVAALENGLPLDYVINTQATAKSKYKIYGNPADVPVCGGYWCPPNSGSGTPIGPHNMWTAYGSSVNTYFVPLFDRVGGTAVMNTARRMGLTFYDVPDNPKDRDGEGTKDDDFRNSTHPDIAPVWSPFALGISTHHPLQIANAYATLAADGVYCDPTPIEAIITAGGQKLDVGAPSCKQAVKAEVARAAIDASRCPVGDKSAYGKCVGATARDTREIVGRPVAGKTGTSDNESTATLTVTTKQLAISGFLVDPDWPDTTQKMKHKGDRGINPAVQWTLAAAMKGKPSIQFTKPTDQKIVFGTQVSIPSVACMSVPQATSVLRGHGFKVEVDDKPVDSPCPAGTAAGTNPSGRTVKGGVVVITISNGKGTTSPTPGKPGKPPGRGNHCPPICIPFDTGGRGLLP